MSGWRIAQNHMVLALELKPEHAPVGISPQLQQQMKIYKARVTQTIL